jgi:nicotinate-nucleotide adenylyltransferase
MVRGILGGSFDPVHNGHVAMARHVLDSGLVQCVDVIPAQRSPHKAGHGAAAEHRRAMVDLAFDGLDGVVVDARELQRPGPSYTVDTLEELKTQNPADDLVLIMGQDTVPTLPHWKDLPRISALARIMVLARDAGAAGSLELPPDLVGQLAITWERDFDEPVSSSLIRAILQRGEEARPELAGLLPPPVLAYISRHELYRSVR